MTELDRLQGAANRTELAASRKLALHRSLPLEEALRITLAASAGPAGLPALLAERGALRQAEAARALARRAARGAALALRQARHEGRPTAWRAWFDGSARPNPGRCGIGARLLGPEGQLVELSEPAGYGNSSEAEYLALIAVLEAALAQGARELTVYGDSRVVLDDVAAPDANSAPVLRPYRARAQALLAQLPGTVLRWVPRHKNLDADALSQRASTPPAMESTMESHAVLVPELSAWHPRLAALAAAHAGNDGAHDASHLERVWRSARLLLEHHPEADALVVLAACYLHDLVNLPKNDPDRAQASRLAARLAREELARLGFPAERVDAVAHAIEAHSFSAAIEPATIEAKIVQDADRLDALGAVGLARMFYVAGRMGRALAHPGDPLALARDLDDGAWTLDHIAVKLAQLPGMMQLEAGRELADRRLARLLAFRDEFAAEWLGTAP